jgi:UDP-N-acetylglucosamine 2-epimerase (non-hydrolysing)
MAPVLHLAVSRSAAVRLAPVAAALAALGRPQALVDVAGECTPLDDAPPRTLGAAKPEALAEAVDDAIERLRPASVLVAGDGDASVAVALAAARRGVPIVRLGAGLRCGDRNIEAETNRLVLDELAELLLADGDDAAEQLRGGGSAEARIRLTGSTIPDAVQRWLAPARARDLAGTLGLPARAFALVTLHKPENTSDRDRVARLTEALRILARRMPVVLCLHPRMQLDGDLARLRDAGVVVTRPLDYLDFLSMETAAGAVLTDSAGVQEETTALGVPCFTLARASERALTLTHGTNVLLGDELEDVAYVVLDRLPGPLEPIPHWDGTAGSRVAAELSAWGGA